MKIQHFINARGKVSPNAKTAGVTSKFSEKEPTKVVRQYTIS